MLARSAFHTDAHAKTSGGLLLHFADSPNVEVTGVTRQGGQAVRPMMEPRRSHGLAGLPWRLRLTDMLGRGMLERRGLEVMLVDARQVKGVSGRKSDVLDCQWLQQLLSYGLLKAAFRPHDQFCVLRELNRLRTRLLREQGRSVQHMQKAMTLMNIQLTRSISDVAGATGQKIIRAIVAGERDAKVLATYRDSRIKASEEELAASLQGTWRAEHLFALKQALGRFDFCAGQLAECESEVESVMAQLHVHSQEPGKGKKRSKAKNAPKFDVREHLFKMCGVDLTKINGIDVSTALNIVAEVGTDLSRFPSDKHFASWPGLCPGTRISGGKVLGSKTKPSVNRASKVRISAIVDACFRLIVDGVS
jgi:transposase